MTVQLTTAGATHWTELQAGGALTNAFGALIFGRGNDVPAADDDETDLARQVALSFTPTAQPVLGDTDTRNTGRGPAIYTYAFTIPPQSTPLVLSNVALAVNPPTCSGPLAIHAAEDVWSEPYRRTLIWLNLGQAAATLFTTFETDPVTAARIRGAGARADVLYGGPGSQVLRVGEVRGKIRRGDSATLTARLYGEDEQPLTDSDVVSVKQFVERYSGSSWEPYRTIVLSGTITSDLALSAAFPYRGGFNFQGRLNGYDTKDGLDRRVTYRIQLADGNTRELVHWVRVAV